MIGRDGELPWRLPEDLAHFRRTTMGRAILMGRKTFESIGKPLPGRRTIVITRDPNWAHAGCERAGSLAEAIALGGSAAPDDGRFPTDEVMVVGGAQIYRDALPLADRIIVTEIDQDFDGDAVLDSSGFDEFRQVSRTRYTSASGIPFSVVEYRRTQD